jgi:hypothetical protein
MVEEWPKTYAGAQVLTIGRMAEMGNPIASPFPLAIYSLPLRLAQQACYWDPKVSAGQI